MFAGSTDHPSETCALRRSTPPVPPLNNSRLYDLGLRQEFTEVEKNENSRQICTPKRCCA